jgi:hypothetical protein
VLLTTKYVTILSYTAKYWFPVGNMFQLTSSGVRTAHQRKREAVCTLQPITKKTLTKWLQNPQVHHRIHNSRPPVPILSQLDTLYTPPASPPRSILISSIYALVFQVVSFPLPFPLKLCTLFSPLPCVSHVPPTSFSLI